MISSITVIDFGTWGVMELGLDIGSYRGSKKGGGAKLIKPIKCKKLKI